MADTRAPAKSPPVTVVIAGMRFGYPHGLGATARVHAYARGLVESGSRVRVVSLLTPDPGGAGPNVAPAGVHEGVPFEYACGTRARASSFLGRRLLEAKVPLGLWSAARRAFRGSAGPRVIIAYTDQPNWIAFMGLLARLSGAKCIVEVCEMPLLYERGPLKRAGKRWLQDVLAYRLVDGFIAISTCLEDYVRLHSPARVQSIRVPILVAASDFDQGAVGLTAADPREIVYVGDLGHEGEVPDLLAAFALVAPHYPDVVLRVVGEAAPAQLDHIVARTTELGIAERVVFAGHVERARLPDLLCSATMHALLRRDALFSRAGFPTKLGEYLASGRPVVVTATGDIPRYLTHGVDAYMAPPGDPERFAAQMRYVLDHASEAREVGVRGRLVAQRQFDYHRHGERLCAFIRSL